MDLGAKMEPWQFEQWLTGHTISFAFANGHISLCGGTLMIINEKVDGGHILAHLPPLH